MVRWTLTSHIGNTQYPRAIGLDHTTLVGKKWRGTWRRYGGRSPVRKIGLAIRARLRRGLLHDESVLKMCVMDLVLSAVSGLECDVFRRLILTGVAIDVEG